MSRLYRLLLTLLLPLLGTLGSATAAFGVLPEYSVHERVTLPLTGQLVDLAPLLPEGTGPVRLRLSGTVTCGYDGSEMDAMAIRAEGPRFQTAGPFVTLPAGTWILSRDHLAHRYLLDMQRGPTVFAAFNIAPLAAELMVDIEEVSASLTGEIILEVLVPVPLVSSAVSRLTSGATLMPAGALPGAGVMMLLLGLLVASKRRSRRPDVLLLCRAQSAARTIQREASCLGPVFKELPGVCRKTMDQARALYHRSRVIQKALWRTRRLSSQAATVQRSRLMHQKGETLDLMQTLVERLEQTAIQLAAHSAERIPLSPMDLPLSDLRHEVEIVLAADREAIRL